ncbi:MAG: glycosyltransferase [Patescibacteria group bacterium]
MSRFNRILPYTNTVRLTAQRACVRWFAAFIFFPVILTVLLFGKRGNKLVWGPLPIISAAYWSHAMQQKGWESITLMSWKMPQNRKEDFDMFFDDTVPKWLFGFRGEARWYCAFLYLLRHACVAHMPASGGSLEHTPLWRLEPFFLKRAGIKTVTVIMGGDAWQSSRIADPALRHTLLISYPQFAQQEEKITQRVRFWSHHADVIIGCHMVDGIGKWHVLTCNPLIVDTEAWKPKSQYNNSNGRNAPVKILHAPSRRACKGTEFIVQAVETLREEGLKVEFTLLEDIPNDVVKERMREADIFADELIITGYGQAAIEGMAMGLPVLSNADQEVYTRVFRRYSFLNECPIVSTTPETVTENLRALVLHPDLRRELGKAGRAYVEKYHSFKMAQYLFGSIYDKILYGKNVDLMNLFHPLTSFYNNSAPKVEHPLEDNHLPSEYLSSHDGDALKRTAVKRKISSSIKKAHSFCT